MRPDVGKSSISAEFGPKTTHHTQPSSAGRENQEKHHANPVQLRHNLTLFAYLNISTFMAQMHLVTVKTELWCKAWQH